MSIGGLRQFAAKALVRFLTREIRNYQRRIPNDVETLKKQLRPGDVMLVEGKARISQIIKYLTQSSWSHSAIYVGDRLTSNGHPAGEALRRAHGEEAQHLLVEADLAAGVIAVPLKKYADYNVRVCRPYCITPDDLESVLEEVISQLGASYDRQHIVDLGRYLTPFHLVPARWRRKAFFFGRSSSRAVVCSTLIARAFLRVRYPILPLLPPSMSEERERGLFPYGRRFRNNHPALALPRDFDLSPYFKILKFNAIEEGPIDYWNMEWEDAPEEEYAPVPVPSFEKSR
jgi:hypothetical protein